MLIVNDETLEKLKKCKYLHDAINTFFKQEYEKHVRAFIYKDKQEKYLSKKYILNTYRVVTYKGMNDFFYVEVEFEDTTPTSDSTKFYIEKQDDDFSIDNIELYDILFEKDDNIYDVYKVSFKRKLDNEVFMNDL